MSTRFALWSLLEPRNYRSQLVRVDPPAAFYRSSIHETVPAGMSYTIVVDRAFRRISGYVRSQRFFLSLSLSLSPFGEHKLRTLVGGPTWNSLRNGWFGLNFLGNDRHSVLSRRSLSSNVKEQRKSLNYHFLFCARNAHSERLLLDELMEPKEINGERDKLHAFLFQKWSPLSLSTKFQSFYVLTYFYLYPFLPSFKDTLYLPLFFIHKNSVTTSRRIVPVSFPEIILFLRSLAFSF